MDVIKALTSRGSTRAFLPDAVPKATVAAILDAARFAPSGSNIQPWQVHVTQDTVRNRIADAVTLAATQPSAEHQPEYTYYPSTWYEPYIGRRRACGWGLYGTLGIVKGDHIRSQAQELRNFCFFDAPVGLFFFLDPKLSVGSWLDTGMFIQSVMLAAQGHGLATCPQAAWLPFHRIIKAHLQVPLELTLVCGMSLGYADRHAIVNQYRPERIDTDTFTTWHVDTPQP
jgi:nitroreductase